MKETRTSSRASVSTEIVLFLKEEEARALFQVVGYGADSFVKWFYKNLGTHYLKPHEDGLRSLFETIRAELPKHLNKADDARAVFRGEKVAIRPDRLKRLQEAEQSLTNPPL